MLERNRVERGKKREQGAVAKKERSDNRCRRVSQQEAEGDDEWKDVGDSQ